MLSGETAAGDHPLRAIQKLRGFAKQAEEEYYRKTDEEERFRKILKEAKALLPPAQWKAQWQIQRVSYSACSLSTGFDRGIKAILVPTALGLTARMVSRFRPRVPIMGAVYGNQPYSEITKRKLILSFGVYPLSGKILDYGTLDKVFEKTSEQALLSPA